MTNELANDLVAYRTYKNKNVAAAGKAFLSLVRDVNPGVLHRKFQVGPLCFLIPAIPVIGPSCSFLGVPHLVSLWLDKT